MYRCQHNKAPRYLMDHCTSVSDVTYRQRLRSARGLCSTAPAQYLWTSGICRSWPDCLVLFCPRTCVIRRFLRTVAVTEDVFIFAVLLVCLAHWRFFTRVRYINPHLTLTLTGTDRPTCKVKYTSICIAHIR